MKRLLAILLVCILSVSVFGGCSSSKPAAESGSVAPSQSKQAEKKQIYLLIQNRGDLSYWDSMAAGGEKAAKDFADKADVHIIETTADVQASLTCMYESADKGADMILTAGGDFRDNLVKVAKEYPDIAVVSMGDNCVNQSGNIYGFDFRTSQAGFLAGMIAADVASQGLTGTTKSKTVGYIGGKDESLALEEFFIGYIQGAKYYDPATKVVYNYVGSFNDPDTARTQALAEYNDAKADIIFACAGGSGNGVHTAAAQVGKYVIGVDSDQSLLYEKDKTIQSRFVTSVLKESGNAVYSIIQRYLKEGTLPFGKYDILGLEVDAVGLVQNDLFNKYVSDAGKTKLETAKKGIVDGSIKVTSVLDKDQTEIKALIEQYINQAS